MTGHLPTSAGHEVAHNQHAHPSTKFYVVIGVILAIITAAEVAVVFVEALAAALVYILVTLSAAKFALVVMFYMHLKTDSRIFSGVFFAPFALATFMTIGMIVLFRILPFL